MHAVLIEFRNTTPYPVQLANALGKLCKITLLLPEAASGLADGLNRTTVDLCFFHMPRYREPANLAMVRDLRRQLRTLDPDLLHITFRHWWGTPGLGRSAPFPLVATVHDVSPHPGDGRWGRDPGFLYPLQWHWAKQIIVHSDADRRKLLSQHGCQRDRVHVVPIGAYDFYETWTRKDVSEHPNTVLFFGRIWAYKGLEDLIEAEPLITREVPDARIVIAGRETDWINTNRPWSMPAALSYRTITSKRDGSGTLSVSQHYCPALPRSVPKRRDPDRLCLWQAGGGHKRRGHSRCC